MRHLGASFALAAGLSAFVVTMGAARDARACGGCFHEPNPAEATVVTDHRMAFALSSQQTVLWDQVKYAGNPAEFVWVLPVHPGTRVELSHDRWLAALDASTQPIIQAPPQNFTGGGFGEDNAGGCGGCMSSADNASAFGTSSGLDGGSGPPPVDVVSQSVVGPYETVTLRSTDPKALESWLLGHGYDIPASVQPIIDAYTSEGFDFIALRLRPGQGVRAMQPVRVVSPGADPSLPLRMVAAGVGQNVGLTLFVIGEGRYEAQNFPNALLDETKLVWDYTQSRSNYQELVTGLMAQGAGRTWVTEYAKHAGVFATGLLNGGTPTPGSGNPSLADAYFAGCGTYTPPYTFQDADGGLDGSADASDDADAGAGNDASSDAASDASGEGGPFDAGRDAQPSDDGGVACIGTCCDFDDLNVAMTGLHSVDTRVTRLRAYLPVDALKVGDLRLVASADQANVENVHVARTTPAPTATGAGLAPARPSKTGTVVTIGAALFAIASMLRTRRR